MGAGFEKIIFRRLLTCEVVIIWRAHFSGQMRVGFVRAFACKNFIRRIPAKFFPGAQGDDDEMSDDGGAVAVFDFGDRVFAGSDATHKIGHVIAADFEVDRIVRQWSGE